MNKQMLAVLAIGLVVFTACNQGAKQSDGNSSPANDTASHQQIKMDTGYLDVNGLHMYYEVHGEGKPIVLLHGSFMNIPMNWSAMLPKLSANRKVIVAEMQGHGRTRDIAREFSYENMADDVSALLKHLKIDSADVLGYSMGGGVAFQMAIRHPEQVRRLIVVSGTYTHDGWWPDAEAMFATITGDMFKGGPIQKQYDSLGGDPAKFNEFVKKVMSPDLRKYDWTKEVRNIQAPIFMVIGDVDGVQYEHALELFRAKGGGKMGDLHGMPKSRLAIIPGTTHVGMMMQRVDWLVPMITDFLDSDLSPVPVGF